jgi:excisionase family DNA binding protein
MSQREGVGDVELLKLGQVAELTGFHIDTLRRWARAGTLPSVVLGRRERRVPRQALMALIDKKLSNGVAHQ